MRAPAPRACYLLHCTYYMVACARGNPELCLTAGWWPAPSPPNHIPDDDDDSSCPRPCIHPLPRQPTKGVISFPPSMTRLPRPHTPCAIQGSVHRSLPLIVFQFSLFRMLHEVVLYQTQTSWTHCILSLPTHHNKTPEQSTVFRVSGKFGRTLPQPPITHHPRPKII